MQFIDAGQHHRHFQAHGAAGAKHVVQRTAKRLALLVNDQVENLGPNDVVREHTRGKVVAESNRAVAFQHGDVVGSRLDQRMPKVLCADGGIHACELAVCCRS